MMMESKVFDVERASPHSFFVGHLLHDDDNNDDDEKKTPQSTAERQLKQSDAAAHDDVVVVDDETKIPELKCVYEEEAIDERNNKQLSPSQSPSVTPPRIVVPRPRRLRRSTRRSIPATDVRHNHNNKSDSHGEEQDERIVVVPLSSKKNKVVTSSKRKNGDTQKNNEQPSPPPPEPQVVTPPTITTTKEQQHQHRQQAHPPTIELLQRHRTRAAARRSSLPSLAEKVYDNHCSSLVMEQSNNSTLPETTPERNKKGQQQEKKSTKQSRPNPTTTTTTPHQQQETQTRRRISPRLRIRRRRRTRTRTGTIEERDYLPQFLQALTCQSPTAATATAIATTCNSLNQAQPPKKQQPLLDVDVDVAVVVEEEQSQTTRSSTSPKQRHQQHQNNDEQQKLRQRRTSSRRSIPPDFYHNHHNYHNNQKKEDDTVSSVATTTTTEKAIQQQQQTIMVEGSRKEKRTAAGHGIHNRTKTIVNGSSSTTSTTRRRRKTFLSRRRLPLHRRTEEPTFASYCVSSSSSSLNKQTAVDVNDEELRSCSERIQEKVVPVVNQEEASSTTLHHPPPACSTSSNDDDQEEPCGVGGGSCSAVAVDQSLSLSVSAVTNEPTTTAVVVVVADNRNDATKECMRIEETSRSLLSLAVDSSSSFESEEQEDKRRNGATTGQSQEDKTEVTESAEYPSPTECSKLVSTQILPSLSRDEPSAGADESYMRTCDALRQRDEGGRIEVDESENQQKDSNFPPTQPLSTSLLRSTSAVVESDSGVSSERWDAEKRKDQGLDRSTSRSERVSHEGDVIDSALSISEERTSQKEQPVAKLSDVPIELDVSTKKTASHTYSLRARTGTTARRKMSSEIISSSSNFEQRDRNECEDQSLERSTQLPECVSQESDVIDSTLTSSGDHCKHNDLPRAKLPDVPIGLEDMTKKTANHTYNLRDRNAQNAVRNTISAGKLSSTATSTPTRPPMNRPKTSTKEEALSNVNNVIARSSKHGPPTGKRAERVVCPVSLMSPPLCSSTKEVNTCASPPSLRKKKRRRCRIPGIYIDDNIESLLLGADASAGSHTTKRKRSRENEKSKLKRRKVGASTNDVQLGASDDLDAGPGARWSKSHENRQRKGRHHMSSTDGFCCGSIAGDAVGEKKRGDDSGNAATQRIAMDNEPGIATFHGQLPLRYDSGVESLGDDHSLAEDSMSDMEWEDGYERATVIAALKAALVNRDKNAGTQRRIQRYENENTASGNVNALQSNNSTFRDAAEMARELLRQERLQSFVDDDDWYTLIEDSIDFDSPPLPAEFD